MTPEERDILLARDYRSGRIYPTDGSPAGARVVQRQPPTVLALTSGLLLALPILALRVWRGPH